MKFIAAVVATVFAMTTVSQAATISISESGRSLTTDFTINEIANTGVGNNITNFFADNSLDAGDTILLFGQNNTADDRVRIVSSVAFNIDLTAFSGPQRRFRVTGGPGNVTLDQNGISSPTSLFVALDPGTYTLNIRQGTTGNRSLSTFDLRIAAVPLPASALLFGPVLAGFAFMRRKAGLAA